MPNCLMKDTDYCATLGRKSCEECEIAKMPAEAQEKIQKDIDIVRALLPEDGVAPLYESETCLFCRDEPKRKREWYALTDFGHVEPKGTKPSIIGIKIKTRIGSMIPLQIAMCSRCKRAHRLTDMLTLICVGTALAVCLALLAVGPIGGALANINEIASLGVIAASLLLGYVVGKIATAAYRKKVSKHVILNLDEIDHVARLIERGWFPINDDGKPHLIFSRERLKKGWFV